jgi:hypothetical protein
MRTPASLTQSSRPAPQPGPRAIPRLTLALLALAACAPGFAQPAQQPPWAVDPAVGVWIPEITQRDCASGAPLAVFKGFSVLHHGGTLSETNTSPPASRGPGWGTWERHGDGYRSVFRFMRYFPDGNLAGYTVVRRTFTLAADGNSLTGVSRLEIQDPAGNLLGTGCATDVTVRFQ